MLGTFILGIAAGWLVPHAEPKVKAALGNLLPDGVPVTEAEWKLYAFAACLLAAALLAAILTDAPALALALGAALGLAGPRMVDAWRASKAPDYDS